MPPLGPSLENPPAIPPQTKSNYYWVSEPTGESLPETAAAPESDQAPPQPTPEIAPPTIYIQITRKSAAEIWDEAYPSRLLVSQTLSDYAVSVAKEKIPLGTAPRARRVMKGFNQDYSACLLTTAQYLGNPLPNQNYLAVLELFGTDVFGLTMELGRQCALKACYGNYDGEEESACLDTIEAGYAEVRRPAADR